MSFIEYKKWFTSIFGLEATEIILDDENECISKKNDLNKFFEEYDRIELKDRIEDKYIVKGCKQCVTKGIMVRQQDIPGFLGKLNEIKYVIIGLEAKLPDNMDIHIAFDQFETSEKEHPLFKKLKTLFPTNRDIKDKAYVTDIAKCNSTNLDRSRKKCFETHFQKELSMLLKFSPELKIILQGTSVEKYFPKNAFKPCNGLTSDNEVKSGSNLLFRRQKLLFDNKEIPTIVLPHGSKQTSPLWKKINEPQNLRKISTMLREFNFN